MARKRDTSNGNFQQVDVPASSTEASEDRHFVAALARGLKVLACFRKGDIFLGNNEIAVRCNLPRSTVSRLTYTLTKLGYLHYVEAQGKYRLGTAIMALGTTMLTGLDIRHILKPYLQELSLFAAASVGLGTRDHRSIIYVEYCDAPTGAQLPIAVGTRIAISTSAMGRAVLAASLPKERDAVLADIRFQDEVSWPETKAAIDKALGEHATLGCCCSFGDWRRGVNAIATGFQPGGGLPAMAINIAGPQQNLSREFLLEEVRPRLIAVAQRHEGVLERFHKVPNNSAGEGQK